MFKLLLVAATVSIIESTTCRLLPKDMSLYRLGNLFLRIEKIRKCRIVTTSSHFISRINF